jgi:ATP diphosphatase
VVEEHAELAQEIARHGRVDALTGELGDLLFAVVNVARHLDVDAESALRGATAKFTRRFKAVEALAAERSMTFESLDLAALDSLWDEVKVTEHRDTAPG